MAESERSPHGPASRPARSLAGSANSNVRGPVVTTHKGPPRTRWQLRTHEEATTGEMPREAGNPRGRTPRRAREVDLYSIRLKYHNRPRLTLETPPLVYQVPILDNRPHIQPFCYLPLFFPCCCENEYRKAYCSKRANHSAGTARSHALNVVFNEDGSDDTAYMMTEMRVETDYPELENGTAAVSFQRSAPSTNPLVSSAAASRRDNDDTSHDASDRQWVPARPEEEDPPPPAHARRSRDNNNHLTRADTPSRSNDAADPYHPHYEHMHTEADVQVLGGCAHLLYRCFCLRCSIAQQTDLLFREEERRQRYPYRFCAEWFFGKEGHYRRSVATILLCDLLSGGLFIPCGCSYQGLGTACFGWRARYLIRCRYGIYKPAFFDLLAMLFLPLQAVDQDSIEMAAHGLFENPTACYHSQMR